MKNEINYRKATFVLSVARLEQLPKDQGKEVAFVGRSNSGKSSAINTLTEQKSLARTSKTPGRTQLINYFEIEEGVRLVDLPGYGYAKVEDRDKEVWQQLIDGYLRSRESLQGLVLLMDIRHPMQDFDQLVLNWAETINLPVHILLTKADKLGYGAQKNALLKIQNKFRGHRIFSVQLFSALKKIGIDELRKKLNQWLNSNL